MTEVTMIGLDLAKNVFQVHGMRPDGHVAFRVKLARIKVLAFFAVQPICTVAMEACASAHYWGRELSGLGHDVKLIPPIYVKPFVKGQKMGWLPPSPDGIAMCQDCGVTATKRRGRQNERYDDRGGFGKARFPTSWGVDDGASEVPQEAHAGPVPEVHVRAARLRRCV